jgi:hypothetical protein
VTVLVTGLVLLYAGWFKASRSGRPSSRQTPPRHQARASDPLSSQAAWRYRRAQSSNWRVVMMYR